MEQVYRISNKIKVVFWDLDDTLWRGTFAEKDNVELIKNRVDIINALNKRGIVNSICSKNDYETTKNKLIEFGIWDYFVFPQIAFTPKGELINKTLRDMHLRAENALFIDDNDINLREVAFYNPGINIINCLYADKLLQNAFLEGKDDSSLSRLNQYKQLEAKNIISRNYSSNMEFLKASHIKIAFFDVDDSKFKRLYELSERTNQLNFTKNRMSEEALIELVRDKSVETKLIHVTDDYGDYGLAGFYSLKDNKLIHFVFSCRIMSMGVEQFVYLLLNKPSIQVVGEVASKLDEYDQVEWISLVKDEKKEVASLDEYAIENILDEKSKIKIFGLGACDLYHPIAYFSMPNQEFIYECNVFKGKERGVNVGTEYIRSVFEMTEDEKNYCKNHFYNYTGHLAFNTRILDEEYDYVILSFHDDMLYKIYENKYDNNLRVILSPARKYGDTSVMNIGKENPSFEEQKTWLSENFTGVYITKERFKENVCWLLDRLKTKTRVILINGPELDFFRANNPKDKVARNQILMINKAIKELVAEHTDRLALVDINKVIKSRDYVTDYVFHLKANTAYNLFIEVVWCIVRNFPSDKPSMLHKVKNGRKVIIFGNGSEARNAFYNLKLGGESPVKYVHYNFEGKKIGTMPVENYKLFLTDNSDEYYVIIADGVNQIEITNKLIELGFKPLKDFAILRPRKYKKCWNEEKV